MFDCLYYWLIAPFRGGITDNPDRSAAFDVDIKSLDHRKIKLSLYCDEKGEPHFFRLLIPDLEEQELPPSLFPTIQILKEHSLTILRLTYREDAVISEVSSVWSFVPKGNPHAVGLEIQEIDHVTYNPASTRELFVQSLDTREHLRLFVDGADKRIPLQYRFLSFYKLLELLFRENGYWRTAALEAITSKYAQDFRSAGIDGSFVAKLHSYRDRCAHIRTGGKGTKQVMGVTHLRLEDASQVERMLPILAAVTASALNERTLGKYALSEKVQRAYPTDA